MVIVSWDARPYAHKLIDNKATELEIITKDLPSMREHD